MPSIKQEVVKILSGFVILLIFLFASLMYLNVNHGIRTDTKKIHSLIKEPCLSSLTLKRVLSLF